MLAIGIGATAGFALGALIYVVLAPWLEDQSGWLRELQGMAWNLVPLLTVVGAAVGGVCQRDPGGEDVQQALESIRPRAGA